MSDTPKRLMKLNESDFSPSEFLQCFFTATAPSGTEREDVLNPVFWAHVAKRITPMSEIRVMPKDGAWYGRYLVVFCDAHQATVKELEFHTLECVNGLAGDAFYPKWISPAPSALWGVIRAVDKEVIKSGFGTKTEAVTWMSKNLG